MLFDIKNNNSTTQQKCAIVRKCELSWRLIEKTTNTHLHVKWWNCRRLTSLSIIISREWIETFSHFVFVKIPPADYNRRRWRRCHRVTCSYTRQGQVTSARQIQFLLSSEFKFHTLDCAASSTTFFLRYTHTDCVAIGFWTSFLHTWCFDENENEFRKKNSFSLLNNVMKVLITNCSSQHRNWSAPRGSPVSVIYIQAGKIAELDIEALFSCLIRVMFLVGQ